MNNTNRREKIFYMVMIIFYSIFPFALFFDVFQVTSTKSTVDGLKTSVDYYNLTNIGSYRIFPLVIGILFIVVSLVLAVFLVADLVNSKYYRAHIKILSGVVMILLASIAIRFTVFLGGIFFMAACCNLFILSFDMKLNKGKEGNKSKNLVIYIPMYIIFLIILICGLTVFSLF